MCELWKPTGGGEGARKAAKYPKLVEESAIFSDVPYPNVVPLQAGTVKWSGATAVVPSGTAVRYGI